MMEEVEASYENVSKVGVEKASTPIAASTHTSRDKMRQMKTAYPNTVSASVLLERGQPMTNQAETQKTGTSRNEATGAARSEQLGRAQELSQGLAMEIFASSDRTRRWTC